MRPGLVAVGALFVVVGAATLVAIVLPADDPTSTLSATRAVDHLAPSNSKTFYVSAQSANVAHLSLNWSATQIVNVGWYATKACSTPPYSCPLSPALASWAGVFSGRWIGSGTSGAVYILYVQAYPTANKTTGVNFTGSFTEHYRTAQFPLPTIPFFVTLSAGAILGGVGAVALYLGLFLPSGVYGPFDAPPGPDEFDDEGEPDPMGSPAGPAAGNRPPAH